LKKKQLRSEIKNFDQKDHFDPFNLSTVAKITETIAFHQLYTVYYNDLKIC